MKIKLLFSFFMLCIALQSLAQGSNLTIFSEDGDKFFLVLNGLRQNETAQTNLRVEGLSQNYYKATIIFEDKTKGEINKNIPVVDPSTNGFADVTYKIKRTKDNELKIRYFSATPVQPNYAAPADVYVMHYGTTPVSSSVTQTTVTTTTAPATNMNMSANGMNVNVTMADPNMQVTQTTTTTTTTNSAAQAYGDPGYTTASGCQYPMSFSDFNSAKVSIKETSFDDTKLSTAKSIADGNCLSSDQVTQICTLFSFEQTRIDFAKYAYAKTTDPGNYFKVNKAFQFDASKTELNNYISNNRR